MKILAYGEYLRENNFIRVKM